MEKLFSIVIKLSAIRFAELHSVRLAQTALGSRALGKWSEKFKMRFTPYSNGRPVR